MKRFAKPGPLTKARKTSLVLVAISCVLIVAAFLIGARGGAEPLGAVLLYLAAAALILALTHTWRRARNFLILFGAGLVGFPLFAVLHNVFYALAEIAKDVAIVHYSMEFLHGAFFIIAIIVCPPAVLIGAVGSVVVAVMNKRRQMPNEAD
jgi:hypothetical protein